MITNRLTPATGWGKLAGRGYRWHYFRNSTAALCDKVRLFDGRAEPGRLDNAAGNCAACRRLLARITQAEAAHATF